MANKSHRTRNRPESKTAVVTDNHKPYPKFPADVSPDRPLVQEDKDAPRVENLLLRSARRLEGGPSCGGVPPDNQRYWRPAA
jgi:hypothetical protein